MKVEGTSNLIGTQHMAKAAQDARRIAGKPERQAPEFSAGEVTPRGKNVRNQSDDLPATPAENPEHATGLARAVEQLQQNAIKNPQATGLQRALERLLSNQEGHAVDTRA